MPLFRRHSRPSRTGGALVADFEAVMNNQATAHTADYVAKQTEQQTMQMLNQATAQTNSVYVTPTDIMPNMQQQLVRSSVDAHLQKAQAAQIGAFAERQLAETEATARQDYLRKKVKVTIVDHAFRPVESYWFDERTGRYSQGTVKFGAIKGQIVDLSLRKNLLVIRPSLKGRLFNPSRKFLVVYVINPKTLKPAIELTLI